MSATRSGAFAAAPPSLAARPGARRALLVVGGWLLLGLFRAGQFWATTLASGGRSTLESLVVGLLLWALAWLVLTPAVSYLCRRFPVERESAFRRVGLHLAIGPVAAVLAETLGAIFERTLLAEPSSSLPFLAAVRHSATVYLHLNLTTYGTLVALASFAHWADRDRAAALRAEALRRELWEARLETLKTHLNPPFFFRTLAAVKPLLREDADAATRMVVHLGELLRLTFRHEGRSTAPLRDELGTVDILLRIEKGRLGERLAATVHADVDLLDAPVPNLVLLPFVEHAVRHGVEARRGAAHVEIRATRASDRLVVTVGWTPRDGAARGAEGDSSGTGDAREEESGLSVVSAAARLTKLYGDGADVTWIDARTARLSLPLTLPPERSREGAPGR